MSKRAVLFINGDLADVSRLKLRPGDFLIGVDGGTKLILKLNRQPNLIVGDFDSYPHPPAPRLFKQSQDLTDTEFALNYCLKHGFKNIIMVGILGTRLDHLLANIFLGVTIIEGKQILYSITSMKVLEGKFGDLVSLIPLSDCYGVSTSGLKWRLQDEVLKFGSGRGVSNVMTGKSARVSLKKGRLLVVYNQI